MSDINPYTSPESDAPSGNPLKIPAFVLLLVAALFLIMWVISVPMMLRMLRAVDTSAPGGMYNLSGQIVFFVGVGISNTLTLLGSIAMLRQRSYTLAMAGAIVACTPLCSPCYVLGIPFGVWALRQLLKPEVRARFS